MKTNIEIKWWDYKEKDRDISLDHQEILERYAVKRIALLRNSGHTEGVLHKPIGARFFRGYWTYNTIIT